MLAVFLVEQREERAMQADDETYTHIFPLKKS